MTLRAKLLTLLVLIGVGAALYAAWAYHIEKLGAARIELRNATLALEAKQRELEQVRRDAATNQETADGLQAEKDRLAAALAAVPAPVIRVCDDPATRRVPAAPAAPRKPVQAPAARGRSASVPTGDQQGRDIGAELLIIARVADELAAQERALLEREARLR